MRKNAPFIHKLLGRLDRLDRNAVQSYLTGLSEENGQFHQILNELSEGVLLAETNGRILFANTRASLWLGLPAALPPKASLKELTADPELSRFLNTHLANRMERLVGDVQVLIPREITLRVVLLPLDSGVLILLDPLTEETGESLQQAKIEALLSLAAGIAHEIGNPLNAISIHLEILKKSLKDLPEAKQKQLEKTLAVLSGETSRLDRIVRNFLKATRKPPLRFKPEDLNQVVETALQFVTPELESRKIKLAAKFDKTLPLFLMDRERLHQAFLNILKNAMEAMPSGGSLGISVLRKDTIASISFKDDGQGIDPETLPHIFEAYFTTKEEGSGLGLMNVYQTVKEHGGRIDVTSKPGKGSLFTLHLPIRQPKLQLTQHKNRG